MNQLHSLSKQKSHVPLEAAAPEAAGGDVLCFVAAIVQLVDEKVSCSQIQIQEA